MGSTILLICEGCGIEFNKSKKEYTRQRKENIEAKFYCTLQCFGKFEGYNTIEGKGNILGLKADNRKDEFSPYRYFLRKARLRDKKQNLTLEFLKELWESQKGICKISGIKMYPPKSIYSKEDSYRPDKASLDRIDNKIGYLQGNVQFVTVMVNYCKQDYSDEEFIELCKTISAYQNNKAPCQIA